MEIVARSQDSLDGGKTLREGRLYRAVPTTDAIGADSRAIRITSDIALAEVTGQAAHVEMVVLGRDGEVVATKIYDLPPFAQRVIGFADVWKRTSRLNLRFRVDVGAGRVVILRESHEPQFARVALRRTPVAVTEATAAPSPSIASFLTAAAFKAAPFEDPATHLVNIRDRWYDPSTGSFLTPDPVGYRDSSNLYTFCGGDPVNCSDPTGTRKANAADKANIAALQKHVVDYQSMWKTRRRATFTDYRYRAIPGLYASDDQVEYTWQPLQVDATTEAEFNRGLSILQNDLTTFQSAVEHARCRPDVRAFAAINGSRWRGGTGVAARRGPGAASRPDQGTPAHAEPVTELSGGGHTAAIPVETLEKLDVRYPHGNVKDSGLPAEGYTLRSRRTGEVLKYGETTRGPQRYSQKYLESVDTEILFEATGTKAQMYEWQHQRILEYEAAHGGQRPPLNKSDF